STVSLLHLHSFPTRRSSDLSSYSRWSPSHTPSHGCLARMSFDRRERCLSTSAGERRTLLSCDKAASRARACSPWVAARSRNRSRSEEHTSELQSRFDLVCRL